MQDIFNYPIYKWKHPFTKGEEHIRRMIWELDYGFNFETGKKIN